MELLHDDPAVPGYRTALMQFLNGFGLDATAILSLARRTEPVAYEPGEVVLTQGAFDEHLYFLVKGEIVISLKQEDRAEALGERAPVTLLGEISYFNGTPATATVAVKNTSGATFLRLPYDQFTDVLDTYPQIKPTLARIGEMRVISQMDGFTSFTRFMDMIGHKRDRLAVNRALFPHLEDTLTLRLLPNLDEQARILEVGDGPGIICEVLREHLPGSEPRLFVQASHLEDAILDPLQSFPSDFSRATYLRERFDAIVTLQVFEHIRPEEIGEQFRRAARLLDDDGLLLVVRLRVVDVLHAAGKQDTSLFFTGLEGVVRRVWPGLVDDEPLIHVAFVDADVDPMMEWNPHFCDAVIEQGLEPPPEEHGVERVLLSVLLEQARRRVFNPEEVNFHWLVWHASHYGLTLEQSTQTPEVGFYYQLYRRTGDAGGQ
ncbi:MAG TPA: cyclic nucleotide-binding domain-containing protein [bacterium]|nr:cyclic nucleotide-binding domain-containing protein [bacterium]